MTDFDPDAYLQKAQSQQTPDFDPDAHLSKAVPTRADTSPVSPSETVTRAVAHEATSMAAAIPAGLRSVYDITTGKGVAETDKRYHQLVSDLTYQPPDKKSQDLIGVFDKASASRANPLTWPGRAADVVAENMTAPSPEEAYANSIKPTTGGYPSVAPIISGALQFGVGAAGAFRGGSPERPPPLTAQQVADRTVANSPQSLGAAAAAPDVSAATPEMRQAIATKGQDPNNPINVLAMHRHLEADSLPVPVRLTEGQVTQNPSILSQEMNRRGKLPGVPERLTEQNGQLVQNIQALRDRVGPDVFTTNHVEHGDTLINAYKEKAADADKVISSKYQALKDAAGGDFPVDAPALLKNATKDLHKDLLFDHAPRAIMSTLGRLSDEDSMTFENYEALRTNLARIMRQSPDGNQVAAAGVIRKAMERLPLKPEAAGLKPLADSARNAAQTQFDELKADPAYAAAVGDKVPADRFVQRFVTGAPRDQVAQMRLNLSENPVAVQTMGVAALDHLRDAAGIDPMGKGNFSQAGYNKYLNAMQPKLSSLVDPKTAEHLQSLGNVAHYTQAQPKGAYVNNSNTFVAGAADAAANAAEGLANVKAGGIPVGSWARKAVQKMNAKKDANKVLEIGAGLNRPLSDVLKFPND